MGKALKVIMELKFFIVIWNQGIYFLIRTVMLKLEILA